MKSANALRHCRIRHLGEAALKEKSPFAQEIHRQMYGRAGSSSKSKLSTIEIEQIALNPSGAVILVSALKKVQLA